MGLNTITILGRVILFTEDCKAGTEIHCLTLLASFFPPSHLSLKQSCTLAMTFSMCRSSQLSSNLLGVCRSSNTSCRTSICRSVGKSAIQMYTYNIALLIAFSRV